MYHLAVIESIYTIYFIDFTFSYHFITAISISSIYTNPQNEPRDIINQKKENKEYLDLPLSLILINKRHTITDFHLGRQRQRHLSSFEHQFLP